MNTAAHTSTLLSPFFTLFGRHMDTVSDGNDEQNETGRPSATTEAERREKIIQLVKSNLRKSYETSKQRYDKRARQIRYNIGDEIWVRTRVLSNAVKGIISKFSPQYRKCRINDKKGTNSYEIADMNGKIIGIYNTDCFKR